MLCAKATSPRTPSASPSSMNMRASYSTVQLGSCGEAFLLKQNAAICDAVPEELAPLRAYRITDPVPQVTTPEPYTLQPEGSVLHRVALIDYGAKRNIARELGKRGCAVTVLPCSAKAEDILAVNKDRPPVGFDKPVDAPQNG